MHLCRTAAGLAAVLLTASILVPTHAHAQDETAPGTLTKLGSMLTFYGFLRIDAVYDTDHMNDTQTPTYVLSDDDADSGSGDFTLYTRLTRLGLDLDGGSILDGADLTGRLEFDFYGSGSGASDSRNMIRLRHAYLKVVKEELSFLAGQTFDLYSPLYPSVNPDTLNWYAGNTGDRRPQVRVGYSPEVGDGKLGVFGAIAMQGAIDSLEIDGAGDGTLDGEDSGVPQLQGRISYAMNLLTEANSEIGVWFAWGQEKTDGAPVGTSAEDTWTASLFGLDVVVPLTDMLKLRGEFWSGENATDFRGGIGQGINATTGKEIASTGYWIELDAALSDSTKAFVGYSVDDPDDGDLPTGGRDRNELIFAGASYKRWSPVAIGWDYTFWTTEYVGLSDGDNNRFRIWISYNF